MKRPALTFVMSRWWMVAIGAMVASWAWSLWFVPAWVALGSGMCTLVAAGLLFDFARKRKLLIENTRTEDRDAEQPKENPYEEMFLPSSVIDGELPQIENMLQSLDSESQSRRNDELLQRWMDTGRDFLAEADALQQEVASVIRQLDHAAGTIGNSFQAVISKAATQARQAMTLLEGTQGATEDGVPQSLQDFIRVTDFRLNRMADEVVRVADLSVKMVKDLDDVQGRATTIDGFLRDVDALSDRTKLIALNAEIQAARAGDEGRGFTVVSNEIRRLSEGSQVFSKQIRAHLKAVRSGLSRTYGNMQTLTAQDMNHALTIKDEVIALTKSLEDKNREVADTVSEINVISREIAEDVKNIVISLQFHDITSQRLGAMLAPMNSIRKMLRQLENDTVATQKRRKMAVVSAPTTAPVSPEMPVGDAKGERVSPATAEERAKQPKPAESGPAVELF